MVKREWPYEYKDTIDNDYKFCDKCGQKLVREERSNDTRYNTRTGQLDSTVVVVLACPRADVEVFSGPSWKQAHSKNDHLAVGYFRDDG